MEVLKAENKEYFANKAKEIAELCRNFNMPLTAPSVGIVRPNQNGNVGRKPKIQGKTLKIGVP